MLLALASPGAGAEDIATLPPGQRPAPGSDEDELWYAMERAERELQQHPRLVRDEALNAYVRGVACRVAGDYCPDLRVYLVEQPWFNASMAPNGMMIVWTGTLLRCDDEAELALVLGHELAHFRQRHSLQRWRQAKRSSAFFGSFGLLAWGAGGGAAGQLAGLVGAAALLQFSREAERAADREGFATAAALGYEPQAGVRLWTRMQAEEDARRYGKAIPVFATHPKTDERLADVRTAAAAYTTAGDTGRAAYRAAIAPFHRRWLEGELSRRMYDTSVAVIGEMRGRAEPELQATYAFFLGEAWRRRGKPGDDAEAAALYAEAVALPAPPPAAFREHGLARRAAGDDAGAVAALHRYLELAPDADDREFVRQYLAEMETPR